MTASPSVAVGADATATATAQPDAKSSATVKHWVTLITGDRVGVDAKGSPVTIEHAEGRSGIPVQIRRIADKSYALPLDAQRLIAQGKLDQQLFDVTTLSKAEYRSSQGAGLKLIVDYEGARPAAKAAVHAAGDTEVSRAFPKLNAEAVTTPKDDAPEIWDALTNGARGDMSRAAASGVDKVWLDGVVKASLDTSVKQIGAPTAWEAGYTGKGVKIAVLDTGVDETHPDLVGQQLAEKNFSTATTTKDAVGHGTHVASIAAGTGAKNANYKGVAPDAKVLDGKVLDDQGFGEVSNILAGMEWAAAEGADIVNLSLGGGDSAEIDPLEAAVNRLSAEKGILFAIAAGNSGAGSGTVGSPGSAEAALTVGAVDDDDKLADFSSRGPRIGDSGIKPDVTAPGVDITAAAAPGSLIEGEVGQQPDGYLTISGTSMATPHVAGAAALLKQQHPDWAGERIKSVLTGSAKGGAYTPFQQGSGRVDLTKAIEQTVFADGPASLSFGRTVWPHNDDTPVTKKVTYRNTGTEDVTLDLALTATDPSGAAAPAGFFALSADKVTVPAGGTAEAELTADTRLGGTKDGYYSAYITATGDGGGQTVRTAAAVDREVESYDLTVKYIGRDGLPAKYNGSLLLGTSGFGKEQFYFLQDESGTAKIRIPKGDYILDSNIFQDLADATTGIDWIAQPKLSITKNTAVTVDARKAKAVDITVPDSAARSVFASPDYSVTVGTSNYGFGWWLDSYKGFRTAHLGPKVTGGKLYQQWGTHFTAGAKTEYDLVYGKKVEQLATGYTKHAKKSELAKLTLGLGASAKNKTGAVTSFGWLPGAGSASAIGVQQSLPSKRTVYVSTENGVHWEISFKQVGGTDEEGFPITEAAYSLGANQTFKAGKSYEKVFNTGVFSPRVAGDNGIYREGNNLYGYVDLFADGKGHGGGSVYTSGKTVLYRNGTKFGEFDSPTTGANAFVVPAAKANYRLTTSVTRSTKVAGVSTRVDASWTFSSTKVTEAKMPISSVKFLPTLGLDSTAKANATAKVPVQVLGEAAKSGNLKALTVWSSYDGGQSWKKLTVSGGKVTVKNPKAGKGISFKAEVVDKKGNKATVSAYNAYLGK
ncbi:S8 family peptidase [Streptomyces sp. NPDC000880]